MGMEKMHRHIIFWQNMLVINILSTPLTCLFMAKQNGLMGLTSHIQI
jgi:hypothetical protein